MHPILVSAALLLLAGAVPDVPAAPAYEFKPEKANDSVSASADGSRTVFIFTSKTGIGGATIRLKSGAWPRDITLRLKDFTMLESFGVTTERIRFGGEMGTSNGGVKALSDKMPFHLPDAAGKYEKEPPVAGHLKVRVEQNKEGIDIILPAHLFAGSKEVNVKWIDAYRH